MRRVPLKSLLAFGAAGLSAMVLPSCATNDSMIYIIGVADKKYLAQTYGARLGKASVTGYCIKFKSLKDVDLDVLEEAIRFGFERKADAG